MEQLTVSTSPHINRRGHNVRVIMTDVLIALFPCLVAAVVFYGYQVVLNLLFAAAACFFSELLYDLIRAKSFNRAGIRQSSVWDFSCFVTAAILTLCMPVYLNVWGANLINPAGEIVFSFDSVLAHIVGGAFAIVLIKKLFGGIGRNFANPAAAARIFLMLCFAGGMLVSTTWADAGVFHSGDIVDTAATWLGSRGETGGQTLLALFLGNTATLAVGETCVPAILLGYLYLVARKRIDWRLPALVAAFTFAFALLFEKMSGNRPDAAALLYASLCHVLSGGLLFTAVFMATDYSTNPNTFYGRAVFACGIALFTVLIRVYGKYDEGASFALLVMNLFVPLIDRYIIPRPFGYVRAKKSDGEGKA